MAWPGPRFAADAPETPAWPFPATARMPRTLSDALNPPSPEQPPSPPSPDARARGIRLLLERYREDGDPSARDEIVRRFVPLAIKLARRYQSSGEPLDDLTQVATIGLIKAVDRFDLDRGVAFSSYAVPTILGELKRYFRDSSWAVHVPRAAQEQALALTAVTDELSKRLGRAPTVGELAEAMGVGPEQVLEAIHASNAHETVSLDAPRGGGDEETDTYADMLGEEDSRLELAEYLVDVSSNMSELDERDRHILYLRFAQDMTQSEIAERIGVSQMQVSRLLRRAIGTLREAVGEQD